MRIIFVRHGHPNYERDCLTELGVKHAADHRRPSPEERGHRADLLLHLRPGL